MPAIPLELVVMFLMALGGALAKAGKAFFIGVLTFGGGIILLTLLYYPFRAVAGITSPTPACFVQGLFGHPCPADIPTPVPTPLPAPAPTPDLARIQYLSDVVDQAWQKDWPTTITALEELVKRDPLNVTWRQKLYAAYYNEAWDMVQRHDGADARAELQKAIALNPDRGEARLLLQRITPQQSTTMQAVVSSPQTSAPPAPRLAITALSGTDYQAHATGFQPDETLTAYVERVDGQPCLWYGQPCVWKRQADANGVYDHDSDLSQISSRGQFDYWLEGAQSGKSNVVTIELTN